VATAKLEAATRGGLLFIWPYETATITLKANDMYKTAEAARIVGLAAPTLASWVDRGLVELDIPSPGTGTPRTFSRKCLDRVALIAELVRLGLPVSESARAASVFADESQPKAGELFARGKTVLLHDADGTRIVNALGDDFGVALHFAFGVANTLVDLDALVERVDAALSDSRTRKTPSLH
jgi:DNA-binding transcriptional MerR regulator